jgi:hypothetical protein
MTGIFYHAAIVHYYSKKYMLAEGFNRIGKREDRNGACRQAPLFFR